MTKLKTKLTIRHYSKERIHLQLQIRTWKKGESRRKWFRSQCPKRTEKEKGGLLYARYDDGRSRSTGLSSSNLAGGDPNCRGGPYPDVRGV